MSGYFSHSKNILNALLLIFIATQYFLYVNTASAPDEIWFYNDALGFSGRSFGELLDIGNHLAYGWLYWFIHVGLIKLGNSLGIHALLLIKFFYFTVKILEAILLLQIAKKYLADRPGQTSHILWVFILYLSIPMTWFQGKITSVDLLLPILTLLIVYHIQKNRPLFAALFFGIGVGLKLNFVALFPFYFGLLYIHKLFSRKLAVYSFILVVGGFIISNPFVFYNPLAFKEHLPQTTLTFSLDYLDHKTTQIFFASDWLWEIVPIGSLDYYINLSVAVFIVFALFFFNRAIAVWLTLSYAVMTVLMLLSPSFFGWYWFPLIALTILSAVHLPKKLVLLIAIFSLFVNLPKNAFQVTSKMMQIQNINDFLNYDLYLRTLIKDDTDFVVDFSEFGYQFTYLNNTIPNIGMTEERKLSALDFLWNYYLRYKRDETGKIIATPLSQYNTVILVIGKRVTQKRGGDFEHNTKRWVEQTFCTIPNNEFILQESIEFGNLQYFVLKKAKRNS